jgi:uncharacterized protein (TIGR02001 family)
MTRHREVGIIKSLILGAAFAAALALPANAQDNPGELELTPVAESKKLTFSGTAAFTTDYIFRGVSNTDENPAVQASFDAAYGMFYAGLWGSNTDFGDGIEIDYYAGIKPKFGNFFIDIGGLYYSFPGFTSIDYFELKTGLGWASGNWALGATNYWSPDNFGLGVNSNATEGGVGYSFNGKLFNFFSPSISGLIGYQSYEAVLPDYAYWNAGLTLGFMERWSADVRYWDTNYSDADCFINSGGFGNCDARVVGTVKATF